MTSEPAKRATRRGTRADATRDRITPELDDLFRWLRIPSVSADPARAAAMSAAAAWAADYLLASGLQSRLEPTEGGPPIVIAHTPKRKGVPTVLLYGHYDVQPAEPNDGWAGDPFEPYLQDNFIVARGATDNKGQTFSHLVGLRRLAGNWPLNVTVLLDGEEEIGSPHLGPALRRLRDELACAVVVISDTSMVEPGWPAICLGLRGLCCLQVQLITAEGDAHSGMFGGLLPNAAEVLCRLLSAARDADGTLRIPGLVTGLTPPHAEELVSWAKLPGDSVTWSQATGAFYLHGESGFTVWERLWARPTFEINGVTSGYGGPGSKTIIPGAASAKISLRLVHPQRAEDVAAQVESFLRARCPVGAKLSVRFQHGCQPYVLSPESPFLRAARRSVAQTFGRDPALVREGLSIPTAALFQQELGVDTLLLGLGLPDCGAHGTNETFPVEQIEAGANLHCALLRELACEPLFPFR